MYKYHILKDEFPEYDSIESVFFECKASLIRQMKVKCSTVSFPDKYLGIKDAYYSIDNAFNSILIFKGMFK